MNSNIADFLPPSLSFSAITVLGLIWGSFFNVLIVRIPREEGPFWGRSKCPECHGVIPWYHNLPILSYILLRARCHQCRMKISIQYPLVEAGTALLFVWFFWHFGWSLQFLAYAVFFSLLLVISVIDLHHRIIPDELSLGGMVAGFLFAFITKDPLWWESLLGILLGGGSFFCIALFYEKVFKREGLGGGDVKLLGMIGAWLGFKSVLLIVLISSALGSVVGVTIMIIHRGNLKTAIPFGPFLAAAAFIYVFWGKSLMWILYPIR